MKKPTTIIQISDIHLFADPKTKLLNINTLTSLREVLKKVKTIYNKTPATLIVLSGDLAQDETKTAYERLITEMQHFSCEIAWIPGNHDNPALMQKLFSKSRFSCEKHFIFGDWQIILLDSHWQGKVAGHIKQEELKQLQNTLELYQHNTLLMLHHHVLPVHCAWLDPLCLKNNEEFLHLIAPYRQVKAVISGHVHQASEQKKHGVDFITTPSTCIQFKPLCNDFALDEVTPGFRVIHLHEDGHLTTELHRVDPYPEYTPDIESMGY